MDFLWTPWRYTYVTQSDRKLRQGIADELSDWSGDTGCVFCNILRSTEHAVSAGMDPVAADRAALVVFRAAHNYVCLNRFPYTSGHIMVVPFEHQASLADLPAAAAQEMMDLARISERTLARVYHPEGFNFGLNLGKSAGAGVAGHLHLHALPRWTGDTNFMTVTAETRILPEDLCVSWERLRTAFAAVAGE